MMREGMRWTLRILLWLMLVISSLGVIGNLLAPPTPPTAPGMTVQQAARLQELGSFAAGFSQVWLTWDGKETMEQRKQRLRPYVAPAMLEEAARIQLPKQEQRQIVSDVQQMGMNQLDEAHWQVRVWAQLSTPAARMMELRVPVTWDAGGNPVIDGLPLLQNVIPPEAGTPRAHGPAAEKGVRDAMRPALEAFFTAYFRAKESSELANFTAPSVSIRPLGGWLELKEIQTLDVYGSKPYEAVIRLAVEDKATGVIVPQIYTLQVTEDQGKYFIASLR
ncbi:conjugal transfer protein [Effusibacillus consociatus]|uniref:Conjugal transfer protein n=1 Tax=Effusibacillus consociatus TaxID=1117041 RepID=A0ABV9PYY6_9BACL